MLIWSILTFSTALSRAAVIKVIRVNSKQPQLYEFEFSNGYPRTRDDAHERASDDRDGNDRERDDGDHGHDPRRRGDALIPEKQWAK